MVDTDKNSYGLLTINNRLGGPYIEIIEGYLSQDFVAKTPLIQNDYKEILRPYLNSTTVACTIRILLL